MPQRDVAYGIALRNGFVGTEEQFHRWLPKWLRWMREGGGKGQDGRPGADGKEGPQGPAGRVGDRGSKGADGKDGLQGHDGWTPLLAVVADGERRVHRIIGWAGGTGNEPESGYYLGERGPVRDIGDATDIRGPAGARGVAEASGASDAGLRRLITRLIEENMMEDFDQAPLDDQTNSGGSPAVLTFTFSGDPVQRVWVKLLAADASDLSEARVRTDGSNPDADTGQPVGAGLPHPFTVVTNEVRVYTPAGKTVSVTGYRRR